ncbi:MAG: O-antigen ligase family protein [Patescibacteria group bacterium]
MVGIIILVSFIIGVQVPIVNKLSFAEVQKILTKPAATAPSVKTPEVNQPVSTQELGGSSSWEIRKIVWTGAVNIWKANPVFGTGVETYAFAYYKYRPVEHNRVSEWNFLYNKAHNEYLNYLATTGIVGLFTYLLFISFFLFLISINLFNKKVKPIRYIGAFKADSKWDHEDPFLLALLTSFISILIINFFGFSVVILNIYLLLIPAFVLILLDLVKGERIEAAKNVYISYAQWIGVAFFGIIGLFMLFMLVRFWYADTKYALGANYSGAGQYQVAYPLLQDAVKLRNEPVFRDQLAVNDSALAATLALQGASESAGTVQNLATEALGISEKLTTAYPNNVVFWKSRVRILYTLSNLDPRFLPMALVAIKKTSELAPTDASILYNLGVLYGQNGDSKNAVEVLEKTVEYKPDYREAHFALAVFYHELAVDKNSKIIDATYHKKAIDRLEYILKYILPTDAQSKQFLDQWNKEQ